MARCNLCNEASHLISKELAVCLKCIREKPEDALELAAKAHVKSRAAFGLPERAPKDSEGISCNLCVNECKIGENETGYCGLRKNEGGKIVGVSSVIGKLSWYLDPLPTNCVGDWVCPGGTGAGYPKYANRPGPERGYKNIAVFFLACSFNCLCCQNWHFKQKTFSSYTSSPKKLVSDIDEKTSCICYFGGDPVPQLPFSLTASKLALDKNKDKIFRICWETNGSMNEELLDDILDIAINSGGCVKFDLKAWDENLHIALTGITNKRTLKNFIRAGDKIKQRPEPPPLLANTLLVPGYIDENEISSIAKFIASINPEIPYSLLAFHPQFYMSDMPLTTKSSAYRCLNVARKAGLKNVRIGNIHLLV